jgi:hypothetical protein
VEASLHFSTNTRAPRLPRPKPADAVSRRISVQKPLFVPQRVPHVRRLTRRFVRRGPGRAAIEVVRIRSLMRGGWCLGLTAIAASA